MLAQHLYDELLREGFEQGEVHTWLINVKHHKGHLEFFKSFLSKQEIQRANQYIKQSDQERHIICYGILRQLISYYLNIPREEIEITTSQHHKPSITNVPDFGFNISHTAEHVLITFQRGAQVGVDIERMAPIDVDTMSDSVFTPSEVRHLKNLSSQAKLKTFYKYWTCKEAFIKAIGLGFHFDTKQITGSTKTHDVIRPSKNEENQAFDQAWYLHSYAMDNNHHVSIVTDKEPPLYLRLTY